MPYFSHLHLHTEYSLSDGLLQIDRLVDRAVELQMPALAITDKNNLFGLVKFYKKCLAAGVKPVIGAEIVLLADVPNRESFPLVLLCKNRAGYKNLSELITRSFLEGQNAIDEPAIPVEWLENHTDGLIALSAGLKGAIGRALVENETGRAEQYLAHFRRLFPDRFYIEIQRCGKLHEDIYTDRAVNLAEQTGTPVVATNDVRFLARDDFEAHEARVCIHQGFTLNDPRRPKNYTDMQYLRSPIEMESLFEDIPEAIENANLIAMRCNLELSLGEYFLPEFPVPGSHDQNSWLKQEAEAGLEKILQLREDITDDSTREMYNRRLMLELEVITGMGFPGYFLIVADFVNWAKDHGIPVGPGRGSGAGSLVAYALGITDLNPLTYDLLFERFLNPERVSLPDFDVDFCMERRDEVIEYVAEKYGHDHVSQIITFGRMAAKAVVRDVGRVLGHPYGYVDQLAKLIPFDLNMTLVKALTEDDVLKQRYRDEEDVKILINLAKKLEGISRNAGKHAGGIVIAPRALTDYMPLYCEKGTSVTSTQFDMGDVEAVGLVKFDFLGLRTLTIIDWAVNDINELLRDSSEDRLDISKIPLDDFATYRLIQGMETTAVFQLESDGIKKLIRRLSPDTFNDLIALVALFRPGPLQSGMVDDFVERKHGRQRVEYPHPQLENILKPTYGVILYQEQVMQIAQLLAGYTLGSADLLRRAMGKKKPEEMAEQRSVFVSGAVANQVNERVATYIFDLMEKFAGYGFNKSHSAAYALLAYQTAWLKAHYPSAFMAAVLSADMDNTDKIVSLRYEIQNMDLVLMPPSINRSELKFKVVDGKTILFGLGAIKGVGEAAINNMIEERYCNGMFSDLFEFCRRVDTRKTNKRVIEALVKSGATDDLGQGRSVLMATLEKALHFSDQHASNSITGQDDLFGLDISTGIRSGEDSTDDQLPYVIVKDWSDHERLYGEKETLGFYLEGHPITHYESELSNIITTTLNEVKSGTAVIVAGYIESVRTRSGIKGKMAELRLDDKTARMHVTVYSEVFNSYRSLLLKDQLIIIKGEAVADDYYESGVSINARDLYTLAQVRERYGSLHLNLNKNMLGNGLLDPIKTLLGRYQLGTNPVYIEYNNGFATTRINFGDEWKIRVNDELVDELKQMIGKENVSLEFPGRINL